MQNKNGHCLSRFWEEEMEAVLIPMKKFMDDIEIPDLVQSTVLKNFAIISDKGLKMSAQKLLDVRVAAQEAERLGELYSNDTLMELTYHLYAAFLCWDKIYVPKVYLMKFISTQ